MQGKLIVTYKLICDNDTHEAISLETILKNEKILKAIKSEFAKGVRNIEITSNSLESQILITTEKELYTFEADKQDFADLIELAEEDARKRKLFKKGCDAIQLIDFETIS